MQKAAQPLDRRSAEGARLRAFWLELPLSDRIANSAIRLRHSPVHEPNVAPAGQSGCPAAQEIVGLIAAQDIESGSGVCIDLKVPWDLPTWPEGVW
jgi:hypothetical protein